MPRPHREREGAPRRLRAHRHRTRAGARVAAVGARPLQRWWRARCSQAWH